MVFIAGVYTDIAAEVLMIRPSSSVIPIAMLVSDLRSWAYASKGRDFMWHTHVLELCKDHLRCCTSLNGGTFFTSLSTGPDQTCRLIRENGSGI